MNGVVFLGDRQLEVRQFPDPSPGPGPVVIEMKAAGVCGSDLRPYRSSPEELGDRRSVTCGHEPCGVVVELGKGVGDVALGDRVMVHHYAGCGQCVHCQTGWTQLCVGGSKV